MNPYLANVVVLMLVYAALSVTLTVVVGQAGLFSVAHALFFGTGAYGLAILSTRYGMGWVPATAAGILISALLGLFIAVVSLRVSEDYLIIGSFGLQVIGNSFLSNLRSVTGGPSGMGGIAPISILGWVPESPVDYIYVLGVVSIIVVLLTRALSRSSFGRIVQAARDDPIALASLGKRPAGYKIAVFTVTSGLAGAIGAIYATYTGFIAPTGFTVDLSITILSMIIVGGLGRIDGAIAGAVILTGLPELIRLFSFPPSAIGPIQQVVYGVALVVIVLLRPSGLISARSGLARTGPSGRMGCVSWVVTRLRGQNAVAAGSANDGRVTPAGEGDVPRGESSGRSRM